MEGTAYHASYGDSDKSDRTEEDSLYRSEYRTCSRDVEKLDKTVFPLLHRNIVHAVEFLDGGSFGVSGSEDLLGEPSVEGSADDKDSNA